MKRWVFLGLALGLSVGAWAQVTVKEPWVRSTVAQQKATGAFMQLQAQQDSRLLGAASPVAGVVEVHEMLMDGGIMKMRQVQALPLPAGRTVELKPGSYHVMLMDLKQPLKPGEQVPLTLTLENPDGQKYTVQVQAPVRALNQPMTMGGPGAHAH